MKVLLVCIGRQENRYIQEYVNYYRKLGVDNIVICDNNFGNEETFDEALSNEIKEGFVIIEDVRNINCVQVPIYNVVFQKYKDKYDWIMFFDCDEFLTIQPINNVKSYLSEPIFQDKNAILVNWMIFDDNDLIYDDGRLVTRRFTRPVPYESKCDYNRPENDHVKSIIHSAIYKPNILFVVNGGNMHVPTNTPNKCDCKGSLVDINDYSLIDYDFSRAYLRHYRFKTISEFADKKMKIQTPDRRHSDNNMIYLVKNFFKVNKLTPEKIVYLRQKGVKIELKTKNTEPPK